MASNKHYLSQNNAMNFNVKTRNRIAIPNIRLQIDPV